MAVSELKCVDKWEREEVLSKKIDMKLRENRWEDSIALKKYDEGLWKWDWRKSEKTKCVLES